MGKMGSVKMETELWRVSDPTRRWYVVGKKDCVETRYFRPRSRIWFPFFAEEEVLVFDVVDICNPDALSCVKLCNK